MKPSLTALVLTLALLAPGISSAVPSRSEQKTIDRATKTIERSRDKKDLLEAVSNLGDIRQPEVVAPLIKALSNVHGDVRRSAADELWRLDELARPAEEALLKLLEDPDAGVRVRAASALEMLGVPKERLVEGRIAGLRAMRLKDRILAARGLVGFVPNNELVDPVIEVAAAETATVFESDLGKSFLNPVDIIQRMNRTKDRSHVGPLCAAIRDGNPGSRFLIKALAELEPLPDDWTHLLTLQLSSSRDADVTQTLLLLSKRVTEEDGVEEWIEPATKLLDSRDENIQRIAVGTLGNAGGYAASALVPLLRLAGVRDERLRRDVFQAIGEIGHRGQAFPSTTLDAVATEALPVVRKAALSDSDDDVRRAAVKTLGVLRLPAEAILDTLVKVARTDTGIMVRFAALLMIRDLGKSAAAAKADLEWIRDNDADKGNRGAAENALHAIKNDEPRYGMNVKTATASPAGRKALQGIRGSKKEFTPTEFWRAITTLDVDATRRFLDAGMPADLRIDDVGMRPLHALFFGQTACSLQVRPTPAKTLAIARLLLERGADPNATDDRGNTPLKLAALACDGEVIRLLLKAGADMNYEDPSGATAFEMTLWSGSDAGDALLEAGFRLPAEKIKRYREGYKDNAKALDLLKRAVK